MSGESATWWPVMSMAGLVAVLIPLSACSSARQPEAGHPAGSTSAVTPSSSTTAPNPDLSSSTALAPSVRPSSPSSGPSDSTPATLAPLDGTAEAACRVGPVPPSAGLDPFYQQGCRLGGGAVGGFWVAASDDVDPEAVERAGAVVAAVFAGEPALAAVLGDMGIRLGVIGADQETTDMPEYRDLYEVFPDVDWNQRARGLGATLERPLVSAGEENILCLPFDRYRGEDILLHEFAHVLEQFGYPTLDPAFDRRLDNAYLAAAEAGIWADTYAAENRSEYWAEGVQSYFGRNLVNEVSDGIHGPIGSPEELAVTDPELFSLIDDHLGDVDLPPHCRE